MTEINLKFVRLKEEICIMYKGLTHQEPRETAGGKYGREYEHGIHKQETQAATKCMKRCSTSLAPGNFKLKQK